MTADPSPTVEQVAREAVGWLATGPQVARLDDVRFVLHDRPLPQPWFAVALRLRLETEDVAGSIDTVRRWFAARGRPEFFWFVSDETTPPDLGDRLLAAGADADEELTAMVLDREPTPVPDDVDVRPVRTYDEFLLHEQIAIEGFGFDPDTAALTLAGAEAAWRHWQSESGRVQYLAWIDGAAVAEAGLAPTSAGPIVLSGGATLPAARGRGAYRALVRARWDEAVRRGHPQLVVQASAMSRPVLERLGFRPVGTVRMFIDRSDRVAPR